MKKKLLIALLLLLVCGALFAAGLPSILHRAGLHPRAAFDAPDLTGRRALIVTTSHGVLNAPHESTGKATGVFASEMTGPYYAFLDAGMTVDLASIRGGKIPIDPQSFFYLVKTPEDDRFLNDDTFQEKTNQSIRVADVDFTAYDVVFLAGGWGAAYDLGYSVALADGITTAYANSKAIIGSVCHGALGLIRAKTPDGSLLLEGRRVTGVTDKQVQELGIDLTPMHPETELRKAGALFESKTAFRDFFATHVTIDQEQRLVTGQNQNSALEAAHRIMALLATTDT